MSAGTHDAANNVAQPKRRMIWIFGGAASAVIIGGLLMQHFRAPAGQAATDSPPGTARVGGPKAKAMAKVGNEIIGYDAVAEECVKRYGREVLDDMIHRMIITKACEEAKITVSDQEVSQEITRIAERFKLDVTAYLQMLQSERNITPMQYRTSVIWPMLALKKLAGEQVEITDAEMMQAFKRNYGERVKVRVIMIETPLKGNEIWEKARRDPDSFEQLAQQYSVDPNSRALGGQVPPIPRYAGNDALEKEAFKLKEGDISGVIDIGNKRYVILKCEGRTVPVVSDIEEVRDTLYDELKESKTQQAVGKVFEKIKANTRVDNYAAGTTAAPERVVPVSAQSSAPEQGGPGQGGFGGSVPKGGAPAATARPAAGASKPAATTTAPPRASRN